MDSGTFMVYFSSKSNFWIVIKKNKGNTLSLWPKENYHWTGGQLKASGLSNVSCTFVPWDPKVHSLWHPTCLPSVWFVLSLILVQSVCLRVIPPVLRLWPGCYLSDSLSAQPSTQHPYLTNAPSLLHHSVQGWMESFVYFFRGFLITWRNDIN